MQTADRTTKAIPPIVLKFGGTSVGTPERIRRVAAIVAAHRARTPRVIVVVSAMGDTTDELIELARAVSPMAQTPRHRREMDMLLSTGERISMALLSMALGDLGVEALSLTGSQSGIITDDVHGAARIYDIRPIRIDEALPRGKVVIVAGFQGVSREKEITTLGRGGSDTTAVALAAHFGSRECIIYTDVDGVFSADPRKVPTARRLERLGWDSALEAAARGAQVLHPRCVELGWKHDVAVRVRSTFAESEQVPVVGQGGTLIEGCDHMSLEGPKFLTLAVKKDLVAAEIRSGLEGARQVRERLFLAGVECIDFEWTPGQARFLLDESKAAAIDAAALGVVFPEPRRKLARISAIGCGLLQSPGIFDAFVTTLARVGLELVASSSSPTILEALVVESQAIDGAVAQVHDRFESQKF